MRVPVLLRVSLISSISASGKLDKIRAIPPVTRAAEMDVPELTFVFLRFTSCSHVSVVESLMEPTAMAFIAMPGQVSVSVLGPRLPAATTTIDPESTAALTLAHRTQGFSYVHQRKIQNLRGIPMLMLIRRIAFGRFV